MACLTWQHLYRQLTGISGDSVTESGSDLSINPTSDPNAAPGTGQPCPAVATAEAPAIKSSAKLTGQRSEKAAGDHTPLYAAKRQTSLGEDNHSVAETCSIVAGTTAAAKQNGTRFAEQRLH